MDCRQHRQALHELVDGTLGPLRQAALEIHLEQCEACRALRDDLARIRELAGSLDRLTPPPRVWLQIAGHLRQEGRLQASPVPLRTGALPMMVRRSHALAAIAAALIVAIGTSLALLYPMLQESGDPLTAATRPPASPGNAPTGTTVQDDIEAEFRLAEQHYQAAITKLEEAAKSDSDAIDAQTAAMIQENLVVIDQAIAESRQAMRSEPSSAPARDSLFGALRRKVALLQETIALVNEMRKGNAAGAGALLDRTDKG